MDELKVMMEEEIKDRINMLQESVKVQTKLFTEIAQKSSMYDLDKEAKLKRVAVNKRMIDKLVEVLYDISKLESDLEVNQLLDSIISDRTRMKNHIEKSAEISILLYEDYMDYTVSNRIISEINYLKITVSKKMKGEL